MNDYYEAHHWHAISPKQRLFFSRLAILPRALGALLERGTQTDHGPPTLLRGGISRQRCVDLMNRLTAFSDSMSIRDFLLNQNEPDDLLIADYAMRWVHHAMPEEEPDAPTELSSLVRWAILTYGCTMD